jgi:hypothetical protein
MANVPDRTHTAIEALLTAAAALGESPASPPERLYSARDKPFGLSPWTFRRWAAEGRLRCHRGARGKLLAWEADVRAAIEAEPYVPPDAGVNPDGDPLEELLARDELEESTGG